VTRLERRLCGSLLRAMIPPASLPGLADAALVDFWPELERAAAPLLLLGLRAATLLLGALGPLAWLGRWRLFPSLAPAEQDALLVRAAGARWYLVRQMVVLLKAVACWAHLRDGAVRARIALAGA
jgi:hypothetical protein